MLSLFKKFGWIAYAGSAAVVVAAASAVYFIGFSGSQNPAVVLPAIAAVNVQQNFVGKQPFGLWTLVCQNLKAKDPAPATAATNLPKKLCRTNARMLVKGPNNKAMVAAGFNILMLDNKKIPAIIFRLPLGARASNQIAFAIDKNTLFTAPLKCTAKECVAQGALPKEALAQMRQGKALNLIYTIKDKQQKDRKVRVEQLLHGFSQSFDAMASALGS